MSGGATAGGGPGTKGSGEGRSSIDLDDEDMRMLQEQQEMLAKEREIRMKFEARMEEEEARLRQTSAAKRVFNPRPALSNDAEPGDGSEGETKQKIHIPSVKFRLLLGYANSHLALGQRVKVAVGQWKLVLRQSLSAVCGVPLHNVTLVAPKPERAADEDGTEVKIMALSKAEAYRIAGAIKIASAGDGLKMALDNRGLGIEPVLAGEPFVDIGEKPAPPAQVQEQEVATEKETEEEEAEFGIDAQGRRGMLERLLRTGRGFGQFLEASFFQAVQELEPSRRVVHVTEGPYMHVTFVLRDPVWVGMASQMALMDPFLLPRTPVREGREESVAAAMEAVWQLPHAAELAAKGMLKEALDVAQRELTSALALKFYPPSVSALAFQRLTVLLNVVGMDMLAAGEGRANDVLEMLHKADALTRMQPQGGSSVCTCGQDSPSTPCNRGLLRLTTLTNLANYYRQRGLLNAAHQYMGRALRLALRTRAEDLQLRSIADAPRSMEWRGGTGADEGAARTASKGVRMCQVVRGGCAAASRLNQGVLLTTMRNYEEGLRCCAAALSRLQEEWAMTKQSLYDPTQSRDAHGPAARSTAMVSEIAVCMFNAGVCHEQLYRTAEATDAYSRAWAIASLLPKKNPLRLALRTYLGSLSSLRSQMEQLEQAGRARTPRSPRKPRPSSSASSFRSPTTPPSTGSSAPSSPASPARPPVSLPLPRNRRLDASLAADRSLPPDAAHADSPPESPDDWRLAWTTSLGLMAQSLGWSHTPPGPSPLTLRQRGHPAARGVVAPAPLQDRPRTAPAPRTSRLARPGWGLLSLVEQAGQREAAGVEASGPEAGGQLGGVDFGMQVSPRDLSGGEEAEEGAVGSRFSSGASNGWRRGELPASASRARGQWQGGEAEGRRGRPATAGAMQASQRQRGSPWEGGSPRSAASLPVDMLLAQSPYLPSKPSSAPRHRRTPPEGKADRAASAGSRRKGEKGEGGSPGGVDGGGAGEAAGAGFGGVGIREESREHLWSDDDEGDAGEGLGTVEEINFVELSKSFLRSGGAESAEGQGENRSEGGGGGGGAGASGAGRKGREGESPAVQAPGREAAGRRGEAVESRASGVASVARSRRTPVEAKGARTPSSRLGGGGRERGKKEGEGSMPPSRSPSRTGGARKAEGAGERGAGGRAMPTPPSTQRRPDTASSAGSRRQGLGGRRTVERGSGKKEGAAAAAEALAVRRALQFRGRVRGGHRGGPALGERLQAEREQKMREAAEEERRRREWETVGEDDAVWRVLLRLDLPVAEGAAARIQMSFRAHAARRTAIQLGRDRAARRLQAGVRRRMELVRHWREGGKEGHKRAMAKVIQGAWRARQARRVFERQREIAKAANIRGMARRVVTRAKEWGGWEGAGPQEVLRGMVRRRDLYEKMYLKHMSRKYKVLPSRFPAETQDALLGLVMERAEMHLCTALSGEDKSRLATELREGLLGAERRRHQQGGGGASGEPASPEAAPTDAADRREEEEGGREGSPGARVVAVSVEPVRSGGGSPSPDTPPTPGTPSPVAGTNSAPIEVVDGQLAPQPHGDAAEAIAS